MKLNDLWRQFINLIPALLVMYVPAVIFIVVLLAVYLTTNVPFSTFVEDPAASMKYSGATGLVSNVGILLQSSAAAVCIFGYLLLRRQGRANGGALFLLSFGLLTALLTIDDFFLIHEAIGDLIGGAFDISDNIGEGLTFAVYVLLFLYIALKNWAVISRSEYLLLCGAIILFALSTFIDLTELVFSFENGSLWSKFFRIGEDIIKFFAIITWFAYLARAALKIVKDRELIES